MKTMYLAALALLLLAACSGDNTQLTDGSAQPIAETGGDIAVETGTAAGQEDDAVQTAPSAKTDDDAKGELESFLMKGGDLEFMVTYDVTTSYGAETQDATLSLYMDGAKKLRTDTKGDSDGEAYESRTYMVDETFVMCNKQDGAWQCFDFDQPQEGEPQEVSVQEEFEENKDAFWDGKAITKAPDRTVAGTRCSCYKLRYNEQGLGLVEWEGCYSKEGVPLYTAMTSPDGSFTQEATAYKTSVPAGAFTPPAEPTSFDDMMAQYGGMIPSQ